jgi:ssDNA-binding Zn-finger/Zn-ribbon topoisomerase 1
MSSVEKKRVGDPCPRCGARLVARVDLFAYRGKTFVGCYCGACNAGWDNADDSMFDYVKSLKLDEAVTADEITREHDGAITLEEETRRNGRG